MDYEILELDACIKGRDNKLRSTNTVGCNYLSLRLIPASDIHVLI